MKEFSVHSRVSRKNAIYTVLGLGLILFILASDIYRWFFLQAYQPVEMLLVGALFVLYIERVGARYTYIAGTTALEVLKRGLFGVRRYEVPYSEVLGIYNYKPKLVSVIKFRRTFRLHSALDDRDVWALAYTAAKKNGDKENCRIYFKPGDEMLDVLTKYLPGKVRITEEEVVQESLRRS
ncbi:MAG TPA: hypothetical protein VN611_14655 [Patescibacteria group bacterium]|nr:hypothetical protein [Patescibacteria group bacterium]